MPVGNDFEGLTRLRYPSCRQSTRIGSQRGFTLLELVLVLVLLGLAYGLTGPLLGEGSAGTEMRAATHQIAAGLRKARSTAITQRREALLMLDMESRTFSVSGDTRVYTLPQPLNYRLYTAQSEVFAGRLGSIRFFPDGSSTGGRVTVSTAGGGSQSVDVELADRPGDADLGSNVPARFFPARGAGRILDPCTVAECADENFLGRTEQHGRFA